MRRPIDEATWRPWVAHVCAAVGVDPALVSPRAVHTLTQAVAEEAGRPMAPVAAFVKGVETGRSQGPRAER